MKYDIELTDNPKLFCVHSRQKITALSIVDNVEGVAGAVNRNNGYTVDIRVAELFTPEEVADNLGNYLKEVKK